MIKLNKICDTNFYFSVLSIKIVLTRYFSIITCLCVTYLTLEYKIRSIVLKMKVWSFMILIKILYKIKGYNVKNLTEIAKFYQTLSAIKCKFSN